MVSLPRLFSRISPPSPSRARRRVSTSPTVPLAEDAMLGCQSAKDWKPPTRAHTWAGVAFRAMLRVTSTLGKAPPSVPQPGMMQRQSLVAT
eukprot:scaffold41830_cov54-Phaeocystis_antarctica.AAC.4